MQRSQMKVQNARRIMHTAMADLLDGEEYRQITIQGIVNQAMVSRNTFYAYFIDKDDLLKDVFLGYLHELREMFNALADSGMQRAEMLGEMIDVAIRSFFHHTSVYESVYHHLDKCFFYTSVYHVFSEALRHIKLCGKHEETRPEILHIRNEFVAAGLARVIGMWLCDRRLYRPVDISRALGPLFLVL